MNKNPIKRRLPCVICAVTLGAVAALASAQDSNGKSHDPLARARAVAKHENLHLLVRFTGPSEPREAWLDRTLPAFRKLTRDHYRSIALPGSSLAARALRQRLSITDDALPALAVLDTRDRVLAKLEAKTLFSDGKTSKAAIREMLTAHKPDARDARQVLAAGIEAARKSKRQVFVYLSAPW